CAPESSARRDLSHSRDFLAALVPLGFEPFDRRNALSALGIELSERAQIELGVAIAQHLLDFVKVLAEISKVNHGVGPRDAV
ncbi:MAG TPA: hypothetical protein VKB26_15510, partial [Candidatus Acidoferrales bacterium]|nr:hypothetical protein [Candidatus Acidoferrales bacterium]